MQQPLPCCRDLSEWLYYRWHQHCNLSLQNRMVSMMKCNASIIAVLHMDLLHCLWCRSLHHCSLLWLFGFGKGLGISIVKDYFMNCSLDSHDGGHSVAEGDQLQGPRPLHPPGHQQDGYKRIIADCEDHCIQGPLHLPCTERAVCIQLWAEGAASAKWDGIS